MARIRPKPPTLDDIKRMARELDVTFTDNRDSFELDKQEPPVNETYRNNRSGINAAYNLLVWHGRLLKNPSARLALAEEYIRQNTSLWQSTANIVQRHVKKATSVELNRQEAQGLMQKLRNERDEEELRLIEEEENKEQSRMQDSFETTPPQQPGQATTIIGTTSYDAEIELSQSPAETALMFARKKRRRDINFVVSSVAKEVDLVVLSVKNPRWPRVLEKTTLTFEEARILRDLLIRPEIAALLDREA